MNSSRIVFMGTPEFAVASLEALINAGKQVVGVVTVPDKPAGRGQKIHQSAVKEYALKHDLPVLQPEKLKDPDFILELKALKADIQVVVAFRMLPEVVWGMPSKGTFNLHGSLLPEYRGAAPIHWAVINGESKTGVTTFFIDEKIDTGAIIAQRELSIAPDDTTGKVHDRLMTLGASLVVETVTAIEDGTASSMPQPKKESFKPAPKLNANNTRIDWSAPLGRIYNKVRGLNPYPAAWSYLLSDKQKIVVKIYQVEVLAESHNLETGKLRVGKKHLDVATPDGFVRVLEIKIPGKRKMKTNDLLNGYTFESEDKML